MSLVRSFPTLLGVCFCISSYAQSQFASGSSSFSQIQASGHSGDNMGPSPVTSADSLNPADLEPLLPPAEKKNICGIPVERLLPYISGLDSYLSIMKDSFKKDSDLTREMINETQLNAKLGPLSKEEPGLRKALNAYLAQRLREDAKKIQLKYGKGIYASAPVVLKKYWAEAPKLKDFYERNADRLSSLLEARRKIEKRMTSRANNHYKDPKDEQAKNDSTANEEITAQLDAYKKELKKLLGTLGLASIEKQISEGHFLRTTKQLEYIVKFGSMPITQEVRTLPFPNDGPDSFDSCAFATENVADAVQMQYLLQNSPF